MVHAYEVSDFSQLATLAGFLSTKVAVQGFFVVSGFLIVMSYERSSSLRSYASKRVRRIYPAYFTVVMLSAVFLVLVSQKTVQEYFSLAWLKYLAANLTFINFLQPSLPGVFDANKFPVVNGALWTLKVEAMFYIAVPVVVYFLRRFPRLPLLILIYLLSIAYSELLLSAYAKTGVEFYDRLARQLPGQMCFFMAGAALFYYLPIFERNIKWCVTAAAVILMVDGMLLPLPWLQPAALASLVVFFGLFLYAGNFGKYGDFSYGVYILHFPILQLLLNTGWFPEHQWLFLLTTIGLTAVGAFLMWNLIEKRFLLRSSHYVAAVESPRDQLTVPQPAGLSAE
ncbi:acyltransferase family protein [Gimesia sp.]|uniref:acyltransferase family protein n=1 Tax=Gimesia sp. TaxID=2024833 RepID=UPI003A935326